MSRAEDKGSIVTQEQRLQARAEQYLAHQPYGREEVDYTVVKASDLGFLKRMKQPTNLPEAEETDILKQKTTETTCFKQVVEKLKAKPLLHHNLTPLEREGMQQVADGIKNLGYHLSTTDKSKRLVLDKKENYRNGLMQHASKDTVVTVEQVRAREELLYDTSNAIIRIFGFGRSYEDEQDKISQSLKPTFCGVTPMSGEAKDHKQGWSQDTGPPKRPLCNGNIGANAGMGKITSLLIKPIRTNKNEVIRTSICSREELLHDVTELNDSLPEKLQRLAPVRPPRGCKTMQDF